jgi:hypothetical protein
LGHEPLYGASTVRRGPLGIKSVPVRLRLLDGM